LPKDQAVENAFSFMNLSHHASNEEINSRFRQLCLQYHPDKDGDVNEFHKLQITMTIIRLSKGHLDFKTSI
jgi:DnaJ-class molecular chaperone